MQKRTPCSSGYYATMVLDTGEHINIKCPENSQDELLDSLENSMNLGTWWVASLIDGCSADYLGTVMERVNMRRVVGMA